MDKTKQLFEEGGTVVATHPTDFIKEHPEDTIHIDMAAEAKVFNL